MSEIEFSVGALRISARPGMPFMYTSRFAVLVRNARGENRSRGASSTRSNAWSVGLRLLRHSKADRRGPICQDDPTAGVPTRTKLEIGGRHRCARVRAVG